MSEHGHIRPAGRGYRGNTPQCMLLMILAEGMGADRREEAESATAQIAAKKPKAPPVHQTCEETKMRVRGSRSKENAQDKM